MKIPALFRQLYLFTVSNKQKIDKRTLPIVFLGSALFLSMFCFYLRCLTIAIRAGGTRGAGAFPPSPLDLGRIGPYKVLKI
jgi:hypothetical protein